MIEIKESPARGAAAGPSSSGIGYEPDIAPNLAPLQAEIRIPDHLDYRLSEIRDALFVEVMTVQAIAMQIINELHESEDIEALVDLRRLWARCQRLAVPAAEFKTILARGRAAQ